MPSMVAETVLAGTLTLSDVVRFTYFHSNRRFWALSGFALLMLLIGVLGIIAVLLPGSKGTLANPGGYYVFMLFWAMLLLGSPYLAARAQHKRQQYLREPIQYRFNDDGARLEGPSFSSEIKWSLVQRINETKSAFLIYQAPQLAWILPKRFFHCDTDLQGWKKYAVVHLLRPGLFHEPGWVGSWF
jgi:hypothetical protein